MIRDMKMQVLSITEISNKTGFDRKTSTIFTSNKSYGDWGEIFHDHVIAAAMLEDFASLYHDQYQRRKLG